MRKHKQTTKQQQQAPSRLHDIGRPGVELHVAAHTCHAKAGAIRCGDLLRLLTIKSGKMTCLAGHISRGKARKLAEPETEE